MKKTKISIVQMWLTIVFVSCFLISNVLAAKRFALPFGITMTAAVIVFPVTYILSDLFSEAYGYKWSRITCYMAFAMNVVMAALFQIGIILPPASFWDAQNAFAATLGSAPKILCASLAGYVVGDFLNDKVFARMKKRHKNDFKGFGARAILSSLVGEICDSTVFLTVAFAGTMPAKALLLMGVTQVALKVGYEVIIFPLTATITKKVIAYENEG